MKWPDCDMEVDSFTRKGVCKQCSTRINQLNYLNKKNGENKEYIPLNIMKTTDPGNYSRIMSKRNGGKVEPVKLNKIEPKREKITRENNPNTYLGNLLNINKISKELTETIEAKMKEKGIQPLSNVLSLAFILPAMYDLFQENNTIKTRRAINAIYENQIVNCLHIPKGVDDLLTNAQNGVRMALIQEQRTPNEYELDLYRCYENFVEYVKSNDTLMKLLDECNEKFKATIDAQQNPSYKCNASYMQDFNFVQSVDVEKDRKLSTPEEKNKYRVRIHNCKGLFGQPIPQTFIYKNKNSGDKEAFIEAYTPDEAKVIVKAIMRDYFSRVKYAPKDIEVTPWEEAPEQECL